jgi:hypothetical protein
MIGMAKTDSFFIRASTDFNGATFAQTAIDCGAYVDALGMSVLRLHNISVQWGSGMPQMVVPAGNHQAAFQLTTQSQGTLVAATDKSVISTGTIFYSDDATAPGNAFISDNLDIAPQQWTNGYLVGVEQLYLGVDASEATAGGMDACYIVLECTVEKLSSSAAMALALSQQ